jgi:hypothetical protein
MLAEQLKRRFERTNRLFVDLVDSLDGDGGLASELPNIRSNSIAAQLWCVVGARTSYLAATRAGAWAGFSCPLTADDLKHRARIVQSLTVSAMDIDEYLSSMGDLGGPQFGFLLDLLEHETQHHGQLIRYLYGLSLSIPASWKERYALD